MIYNIIIQCVRKAQPEGFQNFGFVSGICKNCELAIEAGHFQFGCLQIIMDLRMQYAIVC